MNISNFSKGSEWRRWDLHVHTKFTNKNDRFISETFDSFCVELFKKALKSEIATIGITDYFNIENYKKVKKFVEDIDSNENFTDQEKKNIKKIFILPNIELRMTPVTDNGRLVNIHCLINPSYENSLDNNFFGSIQYSISGRPFKMNRQGLIDLGKSLDSSLNDDDAYKKGIESFVISHSDLQKLLDENIEFRRNVIIAVSNSNNDGVSAFQKHYDLFEDIDKSSLEALRKSIYYLSDCIFSGNEEDKKYFLGQKKDDIKTVIEKCGSLKSCIHGCDAHTESEIFEPDQKRYCWIKSDPNFEGLKQIIYEPEDRVKVQELKPDEKNDYQIIDKIKFIDNSFQPEEIEINQNLTAIIGGKSTGKSILLRNIAQTIDSEEVQNRLIEVNIPKYVNEITDFRVIWRDGQENKKNEETNIKKKIIYIPQSYLNRLIDKKEDKTAIDEIIKNVLYQDDNTKNAFDDLEIKQKENESKISITIDQIFSLIKEYNELSQLTKNIGDKKGILFEVEKLKKEIESFKKVSGMNPVELESYNKLTKEIVEYRNKIESYDKDVRILESKKEIPLFPNIDFFELSDEIKDVIEKEYESIKIKTNEEWLKTLTEKQIYIQENKSKVTEKLKKSLEEISPLTNKVKELRSLNEKLKRLEDEDKKLKEIINNETKLSKLLNDYKELITNITEYCGKFYENIFEAKGEILKQTIISGEMSFDLSIEFRKDFFQKDFINTCDLRVLNQFENGLISDYIFTDNATFKSDIRKIINGIMLKELVLKKEYSKIETIRKLTQNWFIFDYKIKQDNDEISTMSPGKKSFVLLKLLIELDKSKCPILLDQPEDDLDNRSIYEELVKFIKIKKKERQIIIVTHNPNLVVGADAECIIIANQNGRNSKNKTYKFEYISGSLENSFFNENEEETLYKQGIQEHVCDILEGGKEAFSLRKNKYRIN